MYQHTKPRYPVSETANLLGVSNPIVYKLINEGALLSHKEGRRRYVTAEAIDHYIETCNSSSSPLPNEVPNLKRDAA